jgi:hypothetical protein
MDLAAAHIQSGVKRQLPVQVIESAQITGVRGHIEEAVIRTVLEWLAR